MRWRGLMAGSRELKHNLVPTAIRPTGNKVGWNVKKLSTKVNARNAKVMIQNLGSETVNSRHDWPTKKDGNCTYTTIPCETNTANRHEEAINFQKDGDCSFTTIPCEPNAANRHEETVYSWETRLCANNIVYGRFGVLKTFLCVFRVCVC